MFDYYLTWFDKDTPAIYRICKVTKKITYQAIKYLQEVGWELSSWYRQQVISGETGFVRLV